MTRAFDADSADFSGMTDAGPVWIRDILHQVYLNVDEQGTEAAAATAVVGLKEALRDQVVFRADHPFVFLIRENYTGALLFLGRVVNPVE